MKMLIAIDGSEPALNAVRFAVNFVGKLSEPSSVTLINVQDDAAVHYAGRFVGQHGAGDYLRDQSESELAPARALLDAAGIQHDSQVRTGHIASAIVAAAQEANVDVIVLGSKGRSSLRDMLIGSVAKRVMELAKGPVLLVR